MITYKDMIAAADAVVPRLKPAEAKADDRGRQRAGRRRARRHRGGSRPASSRARCTSRAARSKARADPTAPTYNPAFKQDQAVILHCAGGGRAALAGKTLRDMGYTKVFNGGGFKDLAEAGIEVEK